MTDLVKSFTYGENIGEKIAVKFSQEGVVVKATSAADKVCGVTLFAGNEGAKGDVLMLGLGEVSTNGACNAGDLLVATTAGKAAALDISSVDETVFVLGSALETASSDAKLKAIINPQVIVIPVAAEDEEDNQNL